MVKRIFQKKIAAPTSLQPEPPAAGTVERISVILLMMGIAVIAIWIVDRKANKPARDARVISVIHPSSSVKAAEK